MTDKKTPLATEPTQSTDTKAPVTKTAKATDPKVSTKVVDSDKNKVSKLALIAIVIALGSTAGHYFWQQQQSQLLTLKLSEQIDNKNTATFNQYQAQMKQALIDQQKTFAKQLQQVTTQVNDSNQAEMAKLNTAVSQLERKAKQSRPSDWLLHEAEYLIRIAARTLWLEHDTTAAIGLLKNADARLADLNDPAFLPVRELVYLDIKSLELMPTLQTDKIVLTLMAMNKQVAMLPLAMVDVGAETDTNHELSNDLNDWQANLTKTWEKFLDDFIRVRQRTGLIEPLISPEQQQHLKQNLNLKIQLALWAASERKGDIYQKTLTDIKQWLTEFFDLKEVTNQHFLTSLTTLQTQRVSYDYPSELSSLNAIRTALKNQTVNPVTLPTKPKTPPTEIIDKAEKIAIEKLSDTVKTEPEKSPSLPKTQDDAETTSAEKQSDAVKTEPEKISPLPENRDVQPNVEGKT
ncbi:MAG: uroporphyrin-3 C-methyltransferase [Colwellia sp.]|jgi:uroporphyrin-3 C-methyltransferase